MKNLALFLVLTATLSAESLFNGKNLDGWIEDTPGLWKVRDGMIVGSSPGLKYNDFLRNRKFFGDFVLRLKFRLVKGEGNSGIQFRSKPVIATHELSGFQADIGQKYWGCLYDESRRQTVLVQATPASLEGLNKMGWNEYTITAVGNKITLDLNGRRTVTYEETDPGIPRAGLIALQIHGGPPMEVHFKDITIEAKWGKPKVCPLSVKASG
ncbi:MAG: DUF1080 domain-containing protein [Bryobacteraceae bacterium]